MKYSGFDNPPWAYLFGLPLIALFLPGPFLDMQDGVVVDPRMAKKRTAVFTGVDGEIDTSRTYESIVVLRSGGDSLLLRPGRMLLDDGMQYVAVGDSLLSRTMLYELATGRPVGIVGDEPWLFDSVARRATAGEISSTGSRTAASRVGYFYDDEERKRLVPQRLTSPLEFREGRLYVAGEMNYFTQGEDGSIGSGGVAGMVASDLSGNVASLQLFRPNGGRVPQVTFLVPRATPDSLYAIGFDYGAMLRGHLDSAVMTTLVVDGGQEPSSLRPTPGSFQRTHGRLPLWAAMASGAWSSEHGLVYMSRYLPRLYMQETGDSIILRGLPENREFWRLVNGGASVSAALQSIRIEMESVSPNSAGGWNVISYDRAKARWIASVHDSTGTMVDAVGLPSQRDGEEVRGVTFAPGTTRAVALVLNRDGDWEVRGYELKGR